MSDATLGPEPSAPGCTLAAYAALKRLPEPFLRDIGLSQITYDSAPAVRIPYFGPDRTELTVQYRIAAARGSDGGSCLRFKSGTKAQLYGLHRLQQAREAGYVTVVEGPSDTQTLWFHNFAAVGLPGAATWKEDDWLGYFDHIPKIFIVIEPDAGGASVLRWLGASRLRERAWIVRLEPGFKDPSALHIDDPARFPVRWRDTLARAVPWAEQQAQAAEDAANEAWTVCQDLAQSPCILTRLEGALTGLGLVGETRVAKLLFVAMVSRLLPRPVCVAVKGPSSGGKSFLIDRVLHLFPESAYVVRSAMTERALAYSTAPTAPDVRADRGSRGTRGLRRVLGPVTPV